MYRLRVFFHNECISSCQAVKQLFKKNSKLILKVKISNTEASTWWLPVTIKLCMLWRKQCLRFRTACCPQTLTQFDNRWAQQPRLPGQREVFTIQIIFLQRWAFNNSKIKLLPNLSEYMNNEGVCFRNILVFVY